MHRLPDGLETVMGERGYRLSGGERQRLTIARLPLASPKVVILDEATAYLDSESKVVMQEALADELADRTATVIAYRLSAIRVADQSWKQAGSWNWRARHTPDGRYADLYRTQFANQPAAAT